MSDLTLKPQSFGAEEIGSLSAASADPYGINPLATLDAGSAAASLALLGAATPADIDIEVVGASWVAQGAAPAINGQVENVNPSSEDQVIGALHSVLADPNDADILWAGATNGGIWKTTNATDNTPNWTPLIDEFRGLSPEMTNAALPGFRASTSYVAGRTRDGGRWAYDCGGYWSL